MMDASPPRLALPALPPLPHTHAGAGVGGDKGEGEGGGEKVESALEGPTSTEGAKWETRSRDLTEL